MNATTSATAARRARATRACDEGPRAGVRRDAARAFQPLTVVDTTTGRTELSVDAVAGTDSAAGPLVRQIGGSVRARDTRSAAHLPRGRSAKAHGEHDHGRGQADRLSGEPDYLARVRTADLTAFLTLREEVLTTMPGVLRVSTTLVMKHIVDGRL